MPSLLPPKLPVHIEKYVKHGDNGGEKRQVNLRVSRSIVGAPVTARFMVENYQDCSEDECHTLPVIFRL